MVLASHSEAQIMGCVGSIPIMTQEILFTFDDFLLCTIISAHRGDRKR